MSLRCNTDYSNYGKFPCSVFIHVYVCKDTCLGFYSNTTFYALNIEDESLGEKGPIIN